MVAPWAAARGCPVAPAGRRRGALVLARRAAARAVSGRPPQLPRTKPPSVRVRDVVASATAQDLRRAFERCAEVDRVEVQSGVGRVWLGPRWNAAHVAAVVSSAALGEVVVVTPAVRDAAAGGWTGGRRDLDGGNGLDLDASFWRRKPRPWTSAYYAFVDGGATEASEAEVEAVFRELSQSRGKWTAHDLATLALSAGRRGAPSWLFAALAAHLVEDPAFFPDRFWANRLANVAWGFCVGDRGSRFFEETVAPACAARAATFKPRDLAMLAAACARRGSFPADLMDRIADAALFNMGAFDTRAVALTAWAFAKQRTLFVPGANDDNAEVMMMVGPRRRPPCTMTMMMISRPTLFEALRGRALELQLGAFGAQDRARLAWALAAAEEATEDVFAAAAHAALDNLEANEPQDLGTLAWAFATKLAQDGGGPRFYFEKVGPRAIATMEAFAPRDLSALVWAFAKADVAAPDLYEAAARALCGGGGGGRTNNKNPPLVDKCGLRELATIAWAFSHGRIAAPALFKDLARVAVPVLRNHQRENTTRPPASSLFFRRELVSMLLVAFSMSNVEAPDLYEAAATALMMMSKAGSARRRQQQQKKLPTDAVFLLFDEGDAQLMSNAVWAFSNAGIGAPALFVAIAEAARPAIGAFTPKGLATLAWAFSKGRVSAPDLFDAIAGAAARRVALCSPRELHNLAWGFATAATAADPATPPLFAAISREARRRGLRNWDNDPHSLAVLAWAFTKVTKATPVTSRDDEEARRRVFEACDGPAFLQAVAAELLRTHVADARALSVAAWTFAYAPRPSADGEPHHTGDNETRSFADLFAVIAARTAEEASGLGPQELANLALSLAKVRQRRRRRQRYYHPSEDDTTTASSSSSEASFDDHGGDHHHHHHQMMGEPDEGAFFALGRAVRSRAEAMNSQELAMTACAFATAHHLDPQVFDALAAAALRGLQLEGATAKSLVVLAWAFAEARAATPDLFLALALAARPKVPAMSRADLLHFAESFAVAGVSPDGGVQETSPPGMMDPRKKTATTTRPNHRPPVFLDHLFDASPYHDEPSRY